VRNDTQNLLIVEFVLRRSNVLLLIVFSACRKRERNQKIETKSFLLLLLFCGIRIAQLV
jgi:hypothetical protein